MSIVIEKAQMRHYIELICDGVEGCIFCPIQNQCNIHLPIRTPKGANDEEIETLFLALIETNVGQ